MMQRPFMQAHADRGLAPIYCGINDHRWVEYTDEKWTWPTDGPAQQTTRVLLIVCERCHMTPEEASRP